MRGTSFLFPRKKFFVFGPLLALAGTPLVYAEPATYSVASNLDFEQEITVDKSRLNITSMNCNVFENSPSIPCEESERNYQPTTKLEKVIQKSAIYATKFVPLLNSNADGSEYSNLMINDGKNFLVDSGNQFSNGFINNEIQKKPFFAQTSVSINTRTEGETSFSLDSLLKLKEISVDEEGDLKTLLFSQVRVATATDSNGATTNFGIGVRRRPGDKTMVGLNTFWDYRMTDYSDAHSRLGLGGEYLRNGIELRNNWYMSMTQEKTVTVSGTEYKERVVPGWDVEAGYRFPKNPQLAVFARAFNWDYTHTQDNNGLEGNVSWQASPHLNLEVWISNEIDAYNTVVNSSLPKIDETFFGLRFKLTGRKVKFSKTNIKKNMITQMTQPVRRKYEVLIERSAGSFANRAKGS
tara:strand:+ start:429 stop:1655 length:1227 start_codon:yes stop_codon:yes gene_type:complete